MNVVLLDISTPEVEFIPVSQVDVAEEEGTNKMDHSDLPGGIIFCLPRASALPVCTWGNKEESSPCWLYSALLAAPDVFLGH